MEAAAEEGRQGFRVQVAGAKAEEVGKGVARLGQGAFTLIGKGGSAVAVNENHNAGLFAGMNNGFAATPQEGPVAYSTLATLIRDIVGE